MMTLAATGTICAVVAMGIGLAAGCSGGVDASDTVHGPPERSEVSVPDLVGLNPEQAVARLCAAGLVVEAVTVVERTPAVRRRSATFAGFRVRGTEPGPGESVPVGQGIALSVAVPSNAVLALRKGC